MQTAKHLEEAGDQGRFQVYSTTFVVILWTFLATTAFLPSYLFITPTFNCAGTANVKEADACSRIQSCSIEQPYTVTNDAGLYCDQLYVRNGILSAEFAGSVTGLILFIIFGNKFGRKTLTVGLLSLILMGSILMTIGSRFVVLPLIYIGTISIGAGVYSLVLVSLAYLGQVMSDVWRQRSSILAFAFWSVGEILLCPITYMTNWLHIYIFLFIVPLSVLLLMSFFLVEPPEFLFHQKRYEECLDSLNYIARFNGCPQLKGCEPATPITLDSSKELVEGQGEGPAEATFFCWKHMVPLVAISIGLFCNTGLICIIQFSLGDYGYGFQINMLVIGAAEFIGCLITNFFIVKLKRKPTIIISLFTTAALGIVDQFISSQPADLVIISLIRFLTLMNISLFLMMAGETFPFELRTAGMGIPYVFSNAGSMVAPFLISLAYAVNMKTVFIGGILIGIGGIGMFFTKESKIDPEEFASEEERRKYNIFIKGLGKIFDMAVQQEQRRQCTFMSGMGRVNKNIE